MVNTMSKELRNVMESPDKRYQETNHALAKLWRLLMMDVHLRIEEWDKLTTRYYRSPYSRVKKNVTDIASDKNNFYRSIGARSMTWKNFFKAVCILSPVTIEFTIKCIWLNGKMAEATFHTKNPMELWDETMPLSDIIHRPRKNGRKKNTRNFEQPVARKMFDESEDDNLAEDELDKVRKSIRQKIKEQTEKQR
jgi:hypothetical protein